MTTTFPKGVRVEFNGVGAHAKITDLETGQVVDNIVAFRTEADARKDDLTYVHLTLYVPRVIVEGDVQFDIEALREIAAGLGYDLTEKT